MIALETSVVCCWLLGTVQVLGLVSACTARLSEGSRGQTSFQRLFLLFLPLVGGATIASLGLGPGWWLASGTTFALMVLTVTCDFRPLRHATAW